MFFLIRLSQSFDYNHIIRMENEGVHKGRNDTLSYPQKGRKTGLHCTFREMHYERVGGNYFDSYMFNETRPLENRGGFHLIFHDPFEIPSDDATHIMTVANELISIHIFPEVMRFDESFRDFSPVE
jgi:hypothetical protein